MLPMAAAPPQSIRFMEEQQSSLQSSLHHHHGEAAAEAVEAMNTDNMHQSGSRLKPTEWDVRADQQRQQQEFASNLNGLSRTKSVFAMPITEALSLSSISSDSLIEDDSEGSSKNGHRPNTTNIDLTCFGQVMREHINGNGSVHFGAGTRRDMEPFLRQARSMRELARSHTELKVDAAIAGSLGVPYTCLRQERPFLFDEHTYPLHEVLATTLNLPELDLTRAHEIPKEKLLLPLLNRQNRRVFQYAYDNFVTSFCLPLLHSVAIEKNLFHWANPNDSVTYRYQTFPTIKISRPGCEAEPPHCGTSEGHSIGCLFFHVPLTASQGDAAVFVESYPGKEDWHPLQAKSVGLGFLYDGARCLQFGLENSSNQSRVSLEFSVLLYREENSSKNNRSLQQIASLSDHGSHHDLCSPKILNDSFAAQGKGYYEEAVVHLGRACRPGMELVSRKSKTLADPDHRFGPPFC